MIFLSVFQFSQFGAFEVLNWYMINPFWNWIPTQKQTERRKDKNRSENSNTQLPQFPTSHSACRGWLGLELGLGFQNAADLLPSIPGFRAQIPQLSSSFRRGLDHNILSMDAWSLEPSHSGIPTAFRAFPRRFTVAELGRRRRLRSDHAVEFCCPVGLWVRWRDGVPIECVEAPFSLVISNFLLILILVRFWRFYWSGYWRKLLLGF